MRWLPTDPLRAAISALLVVGLGGAAVAGEAPNQAASEAKHAPPSGKYDPAQLMDPLSLIATTPGVWSASRTAAGCYLISPRRTDSSSLAIGQHPRLGAGLFVVNFALSVASANTGETVVIQAAGGDLSKSARVAGIGLLFAPLDPIEIERSLRALKDNRLLGLVIRHTWLAHGGGKTAEAIAKYETTCAGGEK
jgi:hypothetical protein